MRSRALAPPLDKPGLRGRALEWMGLVAEGAALAVAGSGAAFALILGRVLLAALLRGLAFAVFMRLTLRRARAQAARGAASPAWVHPLAALLSVVECAALVEAVNLPVRMSQPQFQYGHWLLVLVFLAMAYVVQARLIDRMVRRQAR